MLCKYGKKMRDFGGLFYSLFSLFFYILGVFLIKQLFHSRLLDMRLVIGYLPSHIQCALME